MPNVSLPGGTTLYTGATNSDYVPFIQTGVAVPTGRTMANGSKAILAYRIYAYAGGYSGSVTCSLQLGSEKTANFTAPSGTATSTGWRTISALLTPGTTTFRLNASNRAYIGRSNGGSPQLQDSNGNTWSGQAIGQYSYYQAPTAPTSLAALASGYTTGSASWEAPSDNGGTAITGYRVQIATNSSFSGATTYNQTGTSKAFTGLTPGVTYYVRVAAKNDVTDEAGTTSVYGSTDSFTTPSYTAPSVPTSVAVASSTPTSATITWTAPASDGGTPVTSYDLQWSLDPTFTGGVTVITGVVSPTLVTPLTPDTQVYFQVRANNAAGNGPWSPSVDVELSGAPSAPPNFVATSALADSISVAWDAPVDDGGSPVTGYRLEISTSPLFSSPTVVDVGTTPRTHTFGSLAANTTFYIRVAGKNSATTSGALFKWSTLTSETIGAVYILLSGVWVPHRCFALRSGSWVDLIPRSLKSGVWNPPL